MDFFFASLCEESRMDYHLKQIFSAGMEVNKYSVPGTLQGAFPT